MADLPEPAYVFASGCLDHIYKFHSTIVRFKLELKNRNTIDKDDGRIIVME